jgi:TetR/AcrR family transcriptional regulator, tetracycline repressor protein
MPGKEQLSQERILAAARALVEEEGLDGLSMRRLAQELDVWPMSVYRYFRDKDELLDAVAAEAAEDFELPEGRGSWRAQITQLLEQARGRLAGAPPGLATRLPRAFFAPGALRLSEAAMAILVDTGFAEREAASAWRALWSYTFGFATFAAAPVAWLPDAEYPTLAEAFADETEFEEGLERLLDGLAARMGERAAAR